MFVIYFGTCCHIVLKTRVYDTQMSNYPICLYLCDMWSINLFEVSKCSVCKHSAH